MNKRNTLNLALLLFIVIAATAAYLDSTRDETKEKPAITSLKQTDIKNITVKRSERPEIYLEKQHGKWRLIKPYKAATNQFRMDTLLRLVETLPQSSYLLQNPQNYGLDKPKLEVSFNKGMANAVTIRFGDSEPIKLRRYVAVNNRLYITNDTFFYALNSVATDYISHKLLPEEFKITRLELPDLVIKSNQGNWSINPEPENYSVDDINELLSEWQNAQAIDIKPLDTKLTINKQATIKITGNQATRLTFYILKNKKGFILADKLKGLQYSFPEEKAEQLLKLPTVAPVEHDAEQPDKKNN